MSNWKRVASFAGIVFCSLRILAATSSTADATAQTFIDTCRVEASATGDLKTGQWYHGLARVRAYAEEKGLPLIAVWSNSGCSYCERLEKNFMTAEFKQLMKDSGYLYCFTWSKDSDGAKRGDVYKWCSRDLTITSFPFVRIYWKPRDGGTGIDKVAKGDTVDGAKVNGTTTFNYFKNALKDYKPYVPPACATGSFANGTGAADQLEARADTLWVDVPLKREGDGVDKGTNETLKAAFPGVAEPVSYPVQWAANESSKTVRIGLRPQGFAFTVGKQIALTLGSGGETTAETHVALVDETKNNPKNPLWFGARDAGTLQPGEWTMDRDLALAKAAAAGGSTLTLIGGSLWCPDCVNADAYLVDTPVFEDWAKDSGIYCAAVDVPAFPKGAKTCLLTYEPTQVSDRYVNATVPPQDRIQSGAGYLSRNMVPQTGNGGTNATAILARNLNLATNAVARGGLCRPECLDDANIDTGTWRTGVPCFVLQNAAGRIVGRLYQFSNVSPTSDAAAAAYVRRLEEIRLLAYDPTEELNRHWLTATTADCELPLRGGQVVSTISAIDTSDYWKLTGQAAWTRATFSVKGTSGATGETNARLNLWRMSNGRAEKVATAAGNLASGFSLANQEIAASSECFIQLEVIETSAAFKLEHEGDSVVTYTLNASSADDSGVLALSRREATAKEADAKKAGGALTVYIPVERTGGATGATNVTAWVDASSSAITDRYEIVTGTVGWQDGERGEKSIAVKVFDDDNADGTQDLALGIGDQRFVLTIVDNDKVKPGNVSLAETVPAMAKKKVVIAEEGSTLEIGVSRINGASGDVACTLTATAGAFDGPATLAWPSRASGLQWTALRLPTLAECPSGKLTVKFGAVSGIKADSSTSTLTVQLVAQGAPRFADSRVALDLVRYCAVSQEVAVLDLAAGAVAKLSKLSGSLPSGLSAKIVADRLILSGTPTGKEGTFEAVYQVSQTLARKTTPGQTLRLSVSLVDLAKLDPAAPGANPSVAKKRTFADLVVFDRAAKRMTGVLTGLAVPPTGRVSAKYKCFAGTISLSAKSWASYDSSTGTLVARLADSKKSTAADVTVRRDGEVEIALSDAAFPGTALDVAAPSAWSASNPATDWMGYYTVAIQSGAGVALAVGNPIVMLRMDKAANAKKGLMSYSGVLPNGQAFTGSATLVPDGLDTVILPIYYRTSKEFFTAALRIRANQPAQAVMCSEDILPWWTHTETVEDACSEVCYSEVVGSVYDRNADLTTTLDPLANGHDVFLADAVDVVPVTIAAKTLKLAPVDGNPAKVKLSLNKSTGLVSGSFKVLNSKNKSVTANFKGVILPDWGDGCPNCGDTAWCSGSFWYADSMDYELKGKKKLLSIKVGDLFYIESN